jgi:hypothetical protein
MGKEPRLIPDQGEHSISAHCRPVNTGPGGSLVVVAVVRVQASEPPVTATV